MGRKPAGESNGKAVTESQKLSQTLSDLKRHARRLKNAHEVVSEFTKSDAMKQAAALIESELKKTIDIGKQTAAKLFDF